MQQPVKTLPHVRVLSRKYSQNKEYIMVRLELTDESYHTMVFETAEEWIKENIWKDDAAVSYLMSLTSFWDWFTNQWNMLDDAFFHKYFEAVCNPQCSVESLLLHYKYYHRVGAIKGMLPDDIIRQLFKWANKK